jgi:lambda family phage portal protein
MKRKARARQKQQTQTGVVQARYDGAGYGRRLRTWNAPPTGPNLAIQGQPKLRDRARDAGRNEWSGASGTRVWTTNLVGIGIVPRPTTKDPELKKRLTKLWSDWCAVADADGVLDYYGLQTLAVRSWLESGEVFIRLRPRRNEDGLPVPLQIQLLESDMVPMIDYDQAPGLPLGNRIRSGVELDQIGRRVAYWCYRIHPGDRDSGGGMANLANLSRVPISQMKHLFEPLRPGQLRGVTNLAPIIAKLRSVMNFDDAVLERQEIANLITMVITNTTNAQSQIDPLTGQPVGSNRDGIEPLEPGTSLATLPGEDVKFVTPPDAGANYEGFIRQQNLGISAGQGTPYELLTGDITNVSDRTLRVIINEFRRHCEQRQWQLTIPAICTFVLNGWADAALFGGQLQPSEAAESRNVTWCPHGWAYINPLQDVNAQAIALQNGLTSRTHIITSRSDDAEEIDHERAEDQAREKSLGLIDPLLATSAGGSGNPSTGAP